MLYLGNIESFKEILREIAITSFSYYDVPNYDTWENFYHAFIMGILYSGSEYYNITSNGEAGDERYDLLLKHDTKNAYIIEFKVCKDGNLEKGRELAFKQIEGKKYDVELKRKYPVVKIAIAFYGKKIKMETR